MITVTIVVPATLLKKGGHLLVKFSGRCAPFFNKVAGTLLLCFLFGCGYTSSSTLPSNIKTIHVENFKNSIDYAQEGRRNIYLPLLEVDTQRAVIERFLFDGNLKIAKEEYADLVLTGELTSYSRGALRYDDNDNVEEYRIQISVNLQLFNTTTQEVDWSESGFTGDADYFVSGPLAKSEQLAVEEAVEDLARRIVERTVENW